MAFFAIIRDSPDPAFDIVDCHLNLWSLPGFARRVLFFDVGLLVDATAPLDHLNLAIPFGTSERSLSDISSTLLNAQIAELIFGNPVTFGEHHDTIDYGSGDAKLQSFVPNDAARSPGRSGRFHSYWTIKLPAPSTTGRFYMRMRFNIERADREWRAMRSSLVSTGVRVNFRVCDVREASGVTGWNALLDQIVPISNLYVFVVANWMLHAESVSPPLRYTRLLEGRAWQPYVRRQLARVGTQPLAVHYWRSSSNAGDGQGIHRYARSAATWTCVTHRRSPRCPAGN